MKKGEKYFKYYSRIRELVHCKVNLATRDYCLALAVKESTLVSMALAESEQRAEVTERTIASAVESYTPRHSGLDGQLGDEIELSEWLESQIRVASKAVIELLRMPRHPDAQQHLRGESIPPLSEDDEEIAFHLLQVHNEGMFHAPESWEQVKRHPEADIILQEWMQHFAPLFNIMAKQSQMPYEEVEELSKTFQARLVEHTQHMRRIWEDHTQGEKESLKSSEVWQAMDWDEPKIRTDHGIDFLRQVVRLPHVVGEGEDTALVLDEVRRTRDSLNVRLTPLGEPVPEKLLPKMWHNFKHSQTYRWLQRHWPRRNKTKLAK